MEIILGLPNPPIRSRMDRHVCNVDLPRWCRTAPPSRLRRASAIVAEASSSSSSGEDVLGLTVVVSHTGNLARQC
jgi:hypothetical protein